MPWERLIALIEPVYPKAGARGGRPAKALASMLRIHFMQQWFALSDPAMEEALHDVPIMRAFAGIDAGEESIPDESTILGFRHLLEAHDLAQAIFAELNAVLTHKGLLLRQGTLVDATLIAAPSSTKNTTGTRDPEMHQTKKGGTWHFGMKAHIGVDAESGLVHSVVCTPANTADVTQANGLLHGDETQVYADAGYQGANNRPQAPALQWHIAMRPGKRKVLDKDTRQGQLLDQLETLKARIRARVEHPFRVIKRQFGHQKVRYRGLAKNTAQVLTLFALANLWMARKALLRSIGEVRA